eukprot:976970-Alexandrium_andersonii.AAC.1
MALRSEGSGGASSSSSSVRQPHDGVADRPPLEVISLAEGLGRGNGLRRVDPVAEKLLRRGSEDVLA